ncbi:MAG: 2-polyprenyl-6-methoxyphenol hydroxylase-like oxidoreductase [Anaerolineaceae bacterium]|nr:2-polyprenyl-6-methoxyphenol hydroxylase-like oxidoreductase [Anaerolineaceae bacterium]
MSQQTNKQESTEMLNGNGRIPTHALVIGSSIAGLTAAKALASHLDRVTIIDRDESACAETFRRGVPQARHAHTLMPQGQEVLEQHFPGIMAELVSSGAVSVDVEKEVAFFHDGAWRTPQPKDRPPSLSCSRPLLENAIYRRVTALPNVALLRGYRATGLVTDNSARWVTGVQLRSGRGAAGQEWVEPAHLVVDASGRQSQAPDWLAALKLMPPEEWRINAFVGYATRIYQQPAHLAEAWKRLYVRPTPPDETRGGILLPEENGRWVVTLVGIAGDYPPTDEAGFLAFARSLPTPRFYEAIKDATPLTEPFGFRRTENRVRLYDKLPRYLEGFLVTGDAVFALNPVYAQGMTAALIGSHVLDKSLKRFADKLAVGEVTGLAAAFQKELRQALDGLWTMSTHKDWHWPMTEVTDNAETLTPGGR